MLYQGSSASSGRFPLAADLEGYVLARSFQHLDHLVDGDSFEPSMQHAGGPARSRRRRSVPGAAWRSRDGRALLRIRGAESTPPHGAARHRSRLGPCSTACGEWCSAPDLFTRQLPGSFAARPPAPARSVPLRTQVSRILARVEPGPRGGLTPRERSAPSPSRPASARGGLGKAAGLPRRRNGASARWLPRHGDRCG